MHALSMILLCLYVAVVAMVCVYGAHRYWMVWCFMRLGAGRRDPGPAGRLAELPRVTVQLPMYNERQVARRVIEAACALDYPRHLLEIQVLDDSTDESADIALEVCRELAQRGHDVKYLHRPNREGFKAGALREGLRQAKGQFVAVFDADFVPAPEALRQTVDYFADERVGMVQMRWSHLNRDESLLTRLQAMYLDGHFVIEQTARSLAGRWFNFNGTAGIWRRACIEQAGGWQHDTLTEDTDLSYRAQLCGWRFVYVNGVCCPAEVPPTVSAFVGQQHRWNKGLIQTAIKLLPRILRSRAPLRTRIEAWFHLTSPLVHVLMLMLVLLIGPAMLAPPRIEWMTPALGMATGTVFLLLGATAAAAFYVASQWAQQRSVLGTIVRLPALLAVGVGISVVNSRAVFEALLGRQSPFVRTPKYNGGHHGDLDPAARRRSIPAGAIEFALGLLMLGCFVASAFRPHTLVGAPFLLLFACGFLAIGWPGVRDALRELRPE